VTVGIGVVTFRLTLGTPHGIGPNLIRQPGGVALDRRAVLGTGCLLLLARTGHLIASYSRRSDAEDIGDSGVAQRRPEDGGSGPGRHLLPRLFEDR
jgi:hypothetical protein